MHGSVHVSTRLSLFCNQIIEAGWLVAIVLIPLHFNHFSSQVFEPDKIVLLRSIAVLMALAWLIKTVERRGTRKQEITSSSAPPVPAPRRSLTQHPVVILALLFLVSYLLSAGLSILPRLSLWGYDERLYGLYTAAAYLVFFFSLLGLLRTRPQVERLITTTLLASVPVAFYGLLQAFNADPLDWLTPTTDRIPSTMGNPIFLGATLSMIVPLTLYRLMETARKRRFLLLGGYLLVLAVQLACILFTQSRGPVLGLMSGLLFGGLLWTLTRHRWRAAKSLVGLSIGLVIFLTVINLPNSPLGFVQDVPYLNRLSQVEDVEGSSQGRVLIWQGAVDLIAANPARWLQGYGPETIRFAYYPYYAAELGLIHGWEVFFDRMHSETFDVLVTTGLLGFLIYVLLFTSLVYYGLTALGLITVSRQRRLFLGLWFAGGVVAVLSFRMLAQTWAYSGAALPAGLLGGLFLYLAGYAFVASLRATPADTAPVSRSFSLLVLLLLAGILTHFVEINVGIAVSATRLLFWLYAALLILLGLFFRNPPGAKDAPERPKKQKRKKPAPAPLRPGRGAMTALSLCVGVMITTLAFSLSAAEASSENMSRIIGMLAGTWVLAGLLLFAETKTAYETPFSLRVPGLYAGASLLPLLVFYAFKTLGLDAATHHLLLFYLIVLLVMATAAWGLRPEAPPSAPKPSLWSLAFAVIGLLGAAALIYTTNLQPMRASMQHVRAKVAFQQRQYDQALSDYRRTLNLDAHREVYQLEMAQLLAMKAYDTPTLPAEADQLFAEAERMLLQAAANNPFEQYHPAALADVYRLWAAKTMNPQRRTERYRQAVATFEKAIRINRENMLIWRNGAALFEQMGDRPQALSAYRQMLARDSTNTALYLQMGRLYRAEQQWQQAAAMYEGAIRHSPQPLPTAHLALTTLYQRLGRFEDAVRAAQRVVDLNPAVLTHHEVLISLYQRLGRCREALAQTRIALQRWPGEEALETEAALLTQQCGE